MEEMKELWQGVDANDSHLKCLLNLRDAYQWSIHDSTYVQLVRAKPIELDEQGIGAPLWCGRACPQHVEDGKKDS
jgi:hypothetical protein